MSACKGMNCGCTDGASHSLECRAQYAATLAGGVFVKSPENSQALPNRIKLLSASHGGLRGLSRVIGVDAGYLSRLANAEKLEPSNAILSQLGLRRVVSYEDALSVGAAEQSDPDNSRSVPLSAEQEQERVAFESVYRHLDLSRTLSAWSVPVYAHSHVDALWQGWTDRAALSAHTSVSAEIEKYKAVCAAAYQCVGALEGPVRFLDALSDAANGAPGDAEGLLPVESQLHICGECARQCEGAVAWITEDQLEGLKNGLASVAFSNGSAMETVPLYPESTLAALRERIAQAERDTLVRAAQIVEGHWRDRFDSRIVEAANAIRALIAKEARNGTQTP